MVAPSSERRGIVTPWILGSGRAGDASAKALALLALRQPQWGLLPARFLRREDPLRRPVEESENPLLVVANPSGLHADAIVEADAAGLRRIVTEKPAVVRREDVARLRQVRADVAVLHVYRTMWGPQMLAKMIRTGELGDIITIEGRSWQASAAERAVSGGPPQATAWKNDESLSGPFDAYMDLATHWVDLVSFLMGGCPSQIEGWLSYKNAEAPHRDTHVQLTMDYAGGGRAFGSISKTMHGATNHLEINVLGTAGSATWTFLRPDELLLGRGRELRVLPRKEVDMGSQQPPFHGLGWLEGYIELYRRFLGGPATHGGGGAATGVTDGRGIPHLAENLDLLAVMLAARLRS